jgi:hypothetical protein
MILKGRICLATLALAALFSVEARADLRPIVVTETSTSGKLVRISLGSSQGLKQGAPVLFSVASRKVAAGRVVQLGDSTAVVAVLEKYGTESPSVDADYELLFGEPFPEAANLPDFVADREDKLPNPGNERFHIPRTEEASPELDDDNYNPEITLHPKLPEPRTFSTHNVTIGVAAFRNRGLPTDGNYDPNNPPADFGHDIYNGFALRYAYTWRANYFLKQDLFTLVSVEATLGLYNFEHTFPSSIQNNPSLQLAEIRVIPIGVEIRYMWEVSKLFRLYPYVGYQYNVVGAINGSQAGIDGLKGTRLTGGAGAQLVMSESVDARLEGGSDGVLGGLVVKF